MVLMILQFNLKKEIAFAKRRVYSTFFNNKCRCEKRSVVYWGSTAKILPCKPNTIIAGVPSHRKDYLRTALYSIRYGGFLVMEMPLWALVSHIFRKKHVLFT